MRKLPILPALIFIGAGLISTSTFAVATKDYSLVRSHVAVLALIAGKPVTEQLANQDGKYLEIEGAVSQLTTGNLLAFSLQKASGEIIELTSRKLDNDVQIGRRVRVLAQISSPDAPLKALTVTPLDLADSVYLPEMNIVAASKAPATKRTTTDIVPNTAQANSNAAVLNVSPETGDVASFSEQPLSDAELSSQVLRYAQHIKEINRQVDSSQARKIAYSVLVKSQRYGIDPRLVFALITQESRFNARAVSSAGAKGLGQLMPGTAAHLGVKQVFDIDQNIDGTIRYLITQLVTFNGNLTYALAAYNAGPANVTRYGGVPPFSETQHYVKVINRTYETLVNYHM